MHLMSSLVTLSDLNRQRLKRAAWIALGLLTLTIIIVSVWLYRLEQDITIRLAEGRFAPAVEFLAAPEKIAAGYVLPENHLETYFKRRRFSERPFGVPLEPGFYSVWTAGQCRSVLPAGAQPPTNDTPPDGATPPPEDGETSTISTGENATAPTTSTVLPPLSAVPTMELGRCIAFHNLQPPLDASFANDVQVVALGTDNRTVIGTYLGTATQAIPLAWLEPELFAQYYGDSPILREEIPLGFAPADCLNALVAIEDAQFLEHGGISVTGLLRAFFANLRKGRVAQGGSTLTQQLVKNYFLSDERTIKRKLNEIAMAILLEGRLDKDKILETYINTIYMGQNGVFQVRGFGSAAQHYFGTDLRDLNLPQCALLAAIVNGPGVFNPFTKPDKAQPRRNHVLDRMLELGFINPEQATTGKAAPLPNRPQRGLTEPAPYFVQTVRRQLKDKGIDESEGLRIYTTLNLRAQEAAYQAVRQGIERLESNNKLIAKLKAAGKNLEAVLLSSDPATGHVEALVGGRGFVRSPYNRAFDSHRQVGSVMKPFVFLTALEKNDENGQPYTPLTLIKDEAFTHKYQGQKWSPKNYDGKFNGLVPMYFALKESLNAATAALGLSVGLSDVVDVAKRMGIESKIEAFPALSLGAFELHPWEVLQAYGAIARFGEFTKLTFMIRVEDLGGSVLFKHEPEYEQVVAPETVAVLVGMMKQTLLTGTARAARLSGFVHPAAGKTGTTNDKKDAWFAGFTPLHAAVVWIGYDDNTSHQLTGASGAVPIWTQYMKTFATSLPPVDFAWPAGTVAIEISADQQAALGVPVRTGETLTPIQLIFKQGQAPATPAPELPPDASPTPNPFKPRGI